jgi:hypothetical protein
LKEFINGFIACLKLAPILFREPVRGGAVISIESEIVKKRSFSIIIELTELLNSWTSLRIHHKNASLDQRPNNMIVYTGTPARYIAIAAPHELSVVQFDLKYTLVHLDLVNLRLCEGELGDLFL